MPSTVPVNSLQGEGIPAPWEIPFLDASKLGFQLSKGPINQDRPFKVLCVGAGLSGIYAGIRIPRSLPGAELIIVDKNADFGGTWFENRYEGCACDIPAHCYQYAFEPNPNWSSFYAPAAEICAYYKSVALKYHVDQYTRFQTSVVHAEWKEEKGKWLVRLESGIEKRTYEEEADVVIQATGSLNAWKWPAVNGLHDFKGTLMHSAQWDPSINLEGKRVALIGSGSTAIQILPRLAPKVKSIDQYVRSPTWLGFPFLGEELDARKGTVDGNFKYLESEKENLSKDTQHSLQYRKHLMKKLNQVHQVTQLNSEMQANALVAMKKSMKEKLVNKDEIASFLTPTFAVGCRRLTPGPGYLEAFQRDNVKMVMKGVKEATESGLVDEDGQLRTYDVIICATGFDTSYAPRFSIMGQENQSLRERWAKFPMSYMSMCVDGFPNYLMINGPNSAVGSGDLVVLFQTQVDYAIKCCQKLRKQSYKSMQPKREAVEEFQQYSQTYFRQTVFGTRCRTWYKAGNIDGPVYALWPGSCLHAVRTLTDPRWEDFEFSKDKNGHGDAINKRTNRFDFLGDGSTVEEALEDGACVYDTAWYVTEPNMLLPHLGQVDGANVINLMTGAVNKDFVLANKR